MAFIKSDPQAPAGFFEAEAAGLVWLTAAEDSGGARIVRVESVSPGRIELERLTPTRPTAAAAASFGRALAETHRRGAPAFGAAPEGWDGANFIGSRPQRCEREVSWGRFYSTQRVLPFADIASSVGSLSARDRRDVERVCVLLERGAGDDDEPARRLHGDLWSGNVQWTAEGVVLIDPAAHGGHRETDLAMLQLFTVPFLHDILAGYDEAFPLKAGWVERVPLHQLHPLAVHAAGHGASYGRELGEAARKALPLLE